MGSLESMFDAVNLTAIKDDLMEIVPVAAGIAAGVYGALYLNGKVAEYVAKPDANATVVKVLGYSKYVMPLIPVAAGYAAWKFGAPKLAMTSPRVSQIASVAALAMMGVGVWKLASMALPTTVKGVSLGEAEEVLMGLGADPFARYLNAAPVTVEEQVSAAPVTVEEVNGLQSVIGG